MNYSEQFNELEQLLLNKSFSALNEKERQSVLAAMTAIEYEQQRAVLLSAQELKTEAVPAAPNVEEILKRVKSPDSKSWFSFPQLNTLMNTRVPVWQVGLGCLIAGYFLIQLFRGAGDARNGQPTLVDIRDTLYQEVVLPLTAPGQGAAFAISNKMADSNYNLYLAFLRENEQANIFFEKPLGQAPIEFDRPNRMRRDSQGIRKTDSL